MSLRTAPALIASLEEAGYPVSDMTENEAAKLHVRHMVGGRTFGSKNELLYQQAEAGTPSGQRILVTGSFMIAGPALSWLGLY